MKCPICKYAEHRVTDTAASGDTIRRRRLCDRCKHRWTTWETSEPRLAFDPDSAREHLDALTAMIGRRG